eukprot:6400553-Amphidinium_carterae.1
MSVVSTMYWWSCRNKTSKNAQKRKSSSRQKCVRRFVRLVDATSSTGTGPIAALALPCTVVVRPLAHDVDTPSHTAAHHVPPPRTCQSDCKEAWMTGAPSMTSVSLSS